LKMTKLNAVADVRLFCPTT